MAIFRICAGSSLWLMTVPGSSSGIPGLNSSLPKFQNRSAKNNDSDPHFPKAVSDMLELEAGTRSLKRLLSVYFCLKT